jgi:hypothetical protein
MGEPSNWLGRPPAIGPAVYNPYRSDGWMYYQDCVVAIFDKNDVICRIDVDPSCIKGCHELFFDFPVDRVITMGEIKSLILLGRVPLAEGDSEGWDYWILANGDCIIDCAPFIGGKKLKGEHRPIFQISKYASFGAAGQSLRFVKRC